MGAQSTTAATVLLLPNSSSRLAFASASADGLLGQGFVSQDLVWHVGNTASQIVEYLGLEEQPTGSDCPLMVLNCRMNV